MTAPSTMFVSLACSGHVLVDLPIFFGPVIGLTLWILYVTRRDRRREKRRASAPLASGSASSTAG